MTWIQRWIDRAYLGWEHLLGASTVSCRNHSSNLGAQLIGYSVAGYEIRVYCQPRHYVREYLWWRWLRGRYCTFRVFGRVTADAPENLQKACELDLTVPKLRPRFVSEDLQRQAAVKAYLDVLLAKLREDSSTLQPLT